MGNLGEFLVVSYRIQHMTEWYAVFNINRPNKRTNGLEVTFLADRLVSAPGAPYPHLVMLVAKVFDPIAAQAYLSDPRWATLAQLIGIDMTSIATTWYPNKDRLLTAVNALLDGEWL